MIAAIEAIDEHGKTCWDILEIEPFEETEETDDVSVKRIARYYCHDAAQAFCDGVNWPELKQEWWRIKFRMACLGEETAEPVYGI